MNRAFSLTSSYTRRITAAIVWIAAVVAPMAASASQLGDILNNIQDTLTIVLRILMTLAFVVFIWGIIKFISAAGNPMQIKQAKGIMIYGLLGLVVMATTTGIIALLQTYFGISGSGSYRPPQF